MATKSVQDWLEALNRQRRALSMSFKDVAERSGMSTTTVRRVLVNRNESTELASVMAIARVLGVDPFPAIPDPEEVREREVRRLAKRVVRMVQGTMGLEAQGLTDPKALAEIEEKAAEEIRAKPRKHLWRQHCRTSIQSRAKRRSTMSPA